MRAQSTISVKLMLSVMVAALALLCASPVSADSSSDTGSVTVEIVPPGTLDRPDSATDPAPGQVYISPGTLSAQVLYMPDPAPGEQIVEGIVLVEDHRPGSDGWTVHLGETSGNSQFLGRVIIGAEGWGVAGWIYEGVHALDYAEGMSLEQTPPFLRAPEGSGNGVTLSYTEIAIDPMLVWTDVEPGVLNIILPAAP